MRRYGLLFPDMIDEDSFMQEDVQQSDLNFDKFHTIFENTFEEVMIFHDSILFNISEVVDDISSPLFRYIYERKRTREMEKQIRYKERMLDKVVSEAEKQKAIEIAEYIRQSNIYLEKQKKLLDIKYKECRREIQTTLRIFSDEMRKRKEKNNIIRTGLESYKATITNLQNEMEIINLEENTKYYYKREYNILCDRINETYNKMVKIIQSTI